MKHKCDGCIHKSEHQEMGFKPFGICTKETDIIEAEKAYKAEKCPFAKPMTHFERIKAMSIEQMAEFLDSNYHTCDFCLNNMRNGGEGCSKGCVDGMIKYLKSEVQDGNQL